MPTYDVTFCTPYMTFEGVQADSKEEAIDKCLQPEEVDAGDGPFAWVAEEVDPNEREED